MSGEDKPAALSTLKREYLSADVAAGAAAEVPGLTPAGDGYGAREEPRPENTVYRDPYHTIYRLRARFRSIDREYRVIECGSRAGVLPVKGDMIMLVGQYRLLVNGLSWEIPGGRIEERETPQEAAVRECFEETGVLCRNLRALAGYHPGMDVFCNPTYLYSSCDIREGRASAAHQGETVEKAWFPLARALDMILSMQIVDAFTMIGVLSYKMRRDLAGHDTAATH